MRFYTRTRRQAPTIIIVALIDVLVVLLIFLIVTTTFKQQPALKLALPQSSQARKPGASEQPPLVVYIDKAGVLRAGNATQSLSVDQLRADLQSQSAGRTNFSIAISADEKAPFGVIIKVMDIAKELKIQSVSAFTKAAGEK